MTDMSGFDPVVVQIAGKHPMLIDAEDEARVRGLTLVVMRGYATIRRGKYGQLTHQMLHRFLIDAPEGTEVDHINGDRLDNRKANLRAVSSQINQLNRKALNRNNRSGIRGIDFDKSRPKRPWRASIMVNRRKIQLGRFRTIDEAFAARRDAEIEYFPELCATTESMVTHVR